MLEHKHLLIRTEVKKPLTTEVDTINWLKNLVSKINMNILDEDNDNITFSDIDVVGANGAIEETSLCNLLDELKSKEEKSINCMTELITGNIQASFYYKG